MPSFTVAEVARGCAGRVVGDGHRRLTGVRSPEAAGPDELAFVSDQRAAKAASSSRAGALLVRSAADWPDRTVIEVADPAQAVVPVLLLFHPRRTAVPGIHATAVVEPAARVDPSAEVGAFVVVGAGARIGAGAILEPHVVVGRGCSVGEGCWLHAHVTLYDGVSLGRGTEVHSGAVLGADGFGYLPGPAGAVKVPQVGTVLVEEDVEIGANACVDRAALEATRVGRGSKIDDLVMVGHNSDVGRGVFLCGQSGLAGSTVVGDGAVLGGQAGAAGHLTIGAGAKVQAQTGINTDVAPGETVHGSPAMRFMDFQRAWVEFRRLPRTARLVRALARKAGLGEEERG